MKRFICLSLVILMSLLSGCGKDSGTNPKDKPVDGFDGPASIVPDSIRTRLKAATPLHTGDTPPDISGGYETGALKLTGGNYTGDYTKDEFVVGRLLAEISSFNFIRNDDGTYDFRLGGESSGSLVYESVEITGKGNDFTVYIVMSDKYEGISYKVSVIISGTLTDDGGIKDFHYTVIMLEKGRDLQNRLLPVNTFLVFESEGGPVGRLKPVYVVSFNANGGSGGVYELTVNVGSSVKLPDGKSIVWDGFDFAGWNTDSAGAGTAFKAGASYKPEGSVTLYADWSPVSGPPSDVIPNRLRKQIEEYTPLYDGDDPPDVSGEYETGTLVLTGGNYKDYSKNAFINWYITYINKFQFFSGEDGKTYIILGTESSGYDTVRVNLTGSGNYFTVYFIKVGVYEKIEYRISIIISGTWTDSGIRDFRCTVIILHKGADSKNILPPINTHTTHEDESGSVSRRKPAYVVSFDANGGSGGIDELTVNAGSSVKLPGGKGIAWSGFDFAGWNTKADGTGTAYEAGASYTPEDSVTLYADWEPVSGPSKEFVPNWLREQIEKHTTFYDGDDPPDIVGRYEITKTVYTGGNYKNYSNNTFINWYISSMSSFEFIRGSGGKIYIRMGTESSGYDTVHVNLTGSGNNFTVYFIRTGIYEGIAYRISIIISGTWTSRGITNLRYTVIILHKESDTRDILPPTGTHSTFEDESEVTKAVHEVAFDANGGEGSVSELRVTDGRSAALPSGRSLTKEEYTFGGWNTKADGTGDNYDAGASYKPTGSVTLYAKWDIIRYTVTYHLNGGRGTVPRAQTVDIGGGVTLPDGGGLTREDYVFDGWSTRTEGGTALEAGSSYTPEGDVTMYVKWKGRFTVTFDVNGGDGTAPDAQTVYEGVAITLPEGEGLERENYTFGGWSTAANGNGTNYEAGAPYTPKRSVTLYARWNGIYTVNFDANGGEGTVPAERSVNEGDVIELPDEDGLTREGYVFGGWKDANDRSYKAGSEYTVSGDVTLFAVWTLYTVRFDRNGGTGTAPAAADVLIGSSIELPDGDGLTRVAYTFAGWNTLINGNGFDYEPGAEFTPTGSTTLFARWERIPGQWPKSEVYWDTYSSDPIVYYYRNVGEVVDFENFSINPAAVAGKYYMVVGPNAASGNEWDLGINQQNFHYKTGEYYWVTIKAKVTGAARRIRVGVNMNHEPWIVYAGSPYGTAAANQYTLFPADATTTMDICVRHYTQNDGIPASVYNGTVDDPEAQFYIDLGYFGNNYVGGEIEIQSVEMVKTTGTTSSGCDAK